MDAAAAGIFKLPADHEIDAALAWHVQGQRPVT